MRRTGVGVAGAAATIMMHALLFSAAIWGGGDANRISRLPDAVGAGANTGAHDGSSIERMIVIQLSPEFGDPIADSENVPKLEEPATPSMLQVFGPDAIQMPPLKFQEDGEATEPSDSDIVAQTKLAGLYEGQIRARIERAWEQPLEVARAPIYSCRVKVRQKRDGQVEDVSLESCEGSFDWMDSLVKAIYSASPLPGPPDPSVFSETFSMQFRSVAAK